ncbi:unnamed protein product, partial [Discosporangium mesarthrocarpum]
VLASYGALFTLWSISLFVLVPVPVNLILTSSLILYIGCHRSLRMRDKSSATAEESETISSEEAMKFPVIGSCVLFGLYLLFKFLDKSLVNLLLAAYFAVIGTLALAATLNPIIIQFVGEVRSRLRRRGRKHKLPLVGEVDLTFTLTELLSLAVGIAFSAVYLKTRHWAMNNIFGMTFCVQAMERISLGSFKVGCILLMGLFVYDVFWVFGGPVMESVAKNVDGPIKILFMISWGDPSADPPVKASHSMLGLGDIVVPG